MNEDRTVFVRLPDGAEVVRYGRAGQWYMERPNTPRAWLKLADAVSWACTPGAQVFADRSGGKLFRAALRRARDGTVTGR